MSVRSRQLRTAGVFILGYSLGVVTLSLFTAFNDVSELSPSSSSSSLRAAPNKKHDHRLLLSVMDYTDPSTVSEKDMLVTDDGSPPQQELLQQEMPQPQLQMPLPQIEGEQQAAIVRHVHVGNMCRCASGILPTIGPIVTEEARDTQIVQPPSLATGMHAKHFIQHPSSTGCSCMKDTNKRTPYASTTTDLFLKKMKLHECPHVFPAKYEWENMPDLGVEETLPLFVGVQSYESPLSLNGTLHNWLDHDLFRRINARDIFVQLNHRSPMDDRIMSDFQAHMSNMERQSPITVLGDPSSNLHPGRTISDMCRRAESHPDSHPNGENLLMFLEKDWNLYNGAGDVPSDGASLERLFRGINALAQRGVPYIRLKRKSKEVSKSTTWPCPSQGFPFECTTAHQHRWTNQPMVVSCKWFLRYLEPFALLDDPIMYGCRSGFQENRYCDWEEALQDGRIAWANSQWVVANVISGNHRVFFHQEVDQ